MITMSEAAAERRAAAGFTPRRTRRILERACRAAGFDPAGARLLRHHTNAVYRLLSAPVVVKVDRPCRVRRPVEVVALVRWLHAQDVPTVPLATAVQPLELDGCAVTFWRYLTQQRPIEAADLAEPLALLHTLRTRPPLWLPTDHLADSFARIARAIDASAILSPFDRRLLHEERLRLAAGAADIEFALRPGLIHGDAHHRNTLWNPASGRGVLCDWESVSLGHPEWDLVTLEVHCRRFVHPPVEYDKFCRDYGIDIRDWSGYPWLRDLRELRMITTNAFKSAPGTAEAREVVRRIAGLRTGTAATWHIL
ncbi:aminoglycoside phosphotransferase family protein [Nocardia terpenica]|nr:aminoglycoside phosphotransferase family protein [Nocardia terpenica]MBF6104130.1 aminoglycoside phosphotransferase family protein [Nocardia terpenica]MBF6111496.1 aminoglycoside phosphotransferase family protein [Nocardia terpenica]MBF6118351.1 aminoglycoside phosphotransferase family protein [Nocardia terpenica]MBF6155673.1 aminoglycoside phosphotransferase family protein [Nocardia terpenica]